MKNLENFTIHQFRGLRDLELKNLGQINLLVGVNNCGKTSVLEALSIYCNPFDITEWLNIIYQRQGKSFILESLEWLFPKFENVRNNQLEKNEILISSDGNFDIEKLSMTYEELEEISISDKDQGERQNLEHILDRIVKEYIVSEENTIKGLKIRIKYIDKKGKEYQEAFSFWEKNNKISRFNQRKNIKIPISIVTGSSHRSTKEFRLLSDATFDNFKPNLIELLQYMDSDIVDLDILLSPITTFSSFNIYLKYQKLGLVPIDVFGDGVRRLLYIALQLIEVQGGILLIDELESTIHTEALQRSFRWIVKWCKKMNVQLFATTHSLEAIDTLVASTELEDDLVLYRLKPHDSKTKVTRHDWKGLKILREELGQEVR